MAERHETTTEFFERATSQPDDTHYVLHLYVAGTNPRSLRAVQQISRLCQEHLADRYELEVIDIYQHPALAEQGQVIAAPTLVRSLPEPLRRIIGDMTDEGKVLLAIGARSDT